MLSLPLVMTPTEITNAFCEILRKEGLSKDIHYVAFTNKHWIRYKQLRDEFFSKNGIDPYDNMRYVQHGVMKYLEE